jgi:hypothetical protein
VGLVISDAHDGLTKAVRRSFQGASWQRCRVHFTRNVLAKVPKASADMVAAALRTVFAHPDPSEVASAWDRVADTFSHLWAPDVGTVPGRKSELMEESEIASRSDRQPGRSARSTRLGFPLAPLGLASIGAAVDRRPIPLAGLVLPTRHFPPPVTLSGRHPSYQ